MAADSSPYVSRGGHKLAAALRSFDLDVGGLICADFGSHVGGFVDCLLQAGAARVHAVDPGYGILDFRLRRDPRVVVHERTNALHFQCPEKCDLVTIDAGWTPQRLILPAAGRCLKAGGRVISLVKPHYEADRRELDHGVLPDALVERVVAGVQSDVTALGWKILRQTESPITGHAGNREVLWLLIEEIGAARAH